MMRIWLMTVGEPLPTDPTRDRLLRTGLLADILVARGHQVVWWSSSVDHVRKRQRAQAGARLAVAPGYDIILLRGVLYRRNLSLWRLVNHIGIARQFAARAVAEPPPDAIVCSLPTLELAAAAVRYARARRVPLALDIRDLWPDIIRAALPAWCRPLAPVVLRPLYRQAALACRGATAITGITPPFVAWGLRYAGRPATPRDRDFPLAYSRIVPPAEAVAEAEQFWTRQGIGPERQAHTLCFFGFLRPQFDFDTVLAALARLPAAHPARLVVCGRGDDEAMLRRLAAAPRVTLAGWVDQAKMWTLMRRAALGLAPYRNTPDFMDSMPTKIVEYLSAGLPVLSSLRGYSADVLERHACGWFYENGRPDSLETLLRRLVEQPQALPDMAARAARLFQERYQAETVYADMATHVETLAAGA